MSDVFIIYLIISIPIAIRLLQAAKQPDVLLITPSGIKTEEEVFGNGN